MSSEELDEQTEEAVIIPTTIVMNDESIQEDIDFIIQHQLSQHTNNQTITYDQDFVSQLTHGYAIYRDIIAELIAPYTDKFGYNEMSLTRRAILLLGYVESKIIDTPANIIINECVELAKSYEDVSAGKLINGIMHQLLDVTIEEIITESHEQHPTNDDTTEHHTTETEDTTQSS